MRNLLQPRAYFHFLMEAREDRSAFRADRGGDDHPVGFDAAELARREVDHHNYFSPDERLWFVVLRDARTDLSDLRADIHRKLKQLVRTHDPFRGLYLAHAHLHLREVLDGDFLDDS